MEHCDNSPHLSAVHPPLSHRHPQDPQPLRYPRGPCHRGSPILQYLPFVQATLLLQPLGKAIRPTFTPRGANPRERVSTGSPEVNISGEYDR